jgi:CubicO group peptidase (beta-lactamase class C family)
MAGAAWWVGSADRVVSQGALGRVEGLEGAAPVTTATPFDLASLTKPLATAPLLALFEAEGALELEAPVGSMLGELTGSRLAAQSLLALAAHTAGLPAWAPLYLEGSCLESYVGQIADLAGPAGPTVYSDLGYIVLGAVLERITGKPLDELFEARIARPLGLERMGFASDRRRFADAAATEQGSRHERSLAGPSGEGHAWRETIPRGEVHDSNAQALGGVAGHAGLFGHLGDVARLVLELLDPHRLPLDARARARLLRAVPGSAGRTVGLVLASRSSAARGILPADAPGHTGFTGTSLWLDPARQTCYVLLTNRVHPRVGPRNFQLVRRAFHRMALRLVHRATGE